MMRNRCEDQPYAKDASPMALSPDYVPESDPEADPEEDDDEDPEEDPIDYPVDGGDDGGINEMDIFARMKRSADMRQSDEEHSAPAYPVVVALAATVPSAEETEPFETDESAATPPPHPAYRMTARITIPEPLPIPAWSDSEVARNCLLYLPHQERTDQINLPLSMGLGIASGSEIELEDLTYRELQLVTAKELGAHKNMREFEVLWLGEIQRRSNYERLVCLRGLGNEAMECERSLLIVEGGPKGDREPISELLEQNRSEALGDENLRAADRTRQQQMFRPDAMQHYKRIDRFHFIKTVTLTAKGQVTALHGQ
ncbi:hypothetical protein Tco_0408059 [Tanacetum coccineum]